MNHRSALLHRATRALLLTFLALNCSILIWYIFKGYAAGFHSDSAAKVLLANEIFKTGSYFPKDWNYVNGDLFVLFGHMFIIPFLMFLPAGFTVHAISGAISAFLILSGIWLLTSLLDVTINRRILIVAIFAAAFSGFMAENLYGQVSYGVTLYVNCYLIYLSYKIISSDRTSGVPIWIALFSLLTLVIWNNPQRALIYSGLPIVSAICWQCYYYRKSNNFLFMRRSLQLLVAAVIAIMAGSILHTMTLSGVNNYKGSGHAMWLAYDLMLRNAALTFGSILSILGGLPSSGDTVVSLKGGYEMTRLIAALLLVSLIPYSLSLSLKKRLSGSSFIAVFTITSLAPVFLLQITTTLPDMRDPVQSSRYLVPAMCLCIVIALSQPYSIFDRFTTLAFGVAAVTFLIFGYQNLVRSNLNSQLNWGQPGQYQSKRGELENFLIEHGLRYGYASYWNAGALSVLSDGKVLVRQIVFSRGQPMPMRHLSSDRWYLPDTWPGETFLLLTDKEVDLIDWEQMSLYNHDPVKKLNFGGFNIFIFKDNIAKGLPGWDQRYIKPNFMPVSKHSLSQVGRFVKDYGGSGPALVAEKEDVGALHFGPYIDIQPGHYKATFNVLAPSDSAGAVVARLDVSSATDQQILTEKKLKFGDGAESLFFDLNKRSTIEFRVWSMGVDKVVFKGVEIERVN